MIILNFLNEFCLKTRIPLLIMVNFLLIAFSSLFLVQIVHATWNNPHSDEKVASPILFGTFSLPPKHLDPVISYNKNESVILGQIYEPLLQYHYFKQPYTLEPLILVEMPGIYFLNKLGERVARDDESAVFSKYYFKIKDNIQFQPHPAFVKDEFGEFKFHNLSASELRKIRKISDFEQTSTRILVAQDFVYAIQRMGLRQNHSPILNTISKHIVGIKEYSKKVSEAFEENDNFNIREVEISGVEVISDTEFSIKIKGHYPQFLYWLSMNFFAPIPWEAVDFYQQPGLVKKNITLNTYPVGTGPYMLVENNPNRRMHLIRNPNYNHGFFPTYGLPEGADPILLKDAGKPLPFIEEVIFSLEKESVPLWNKFLQGYYDASGVSSDSFAQAMNVSVIGSMSLTPEMEEKGIRFLNVTQPTIFYLAFNMVDPVVGGYDEKSRKLRQAISIAINKEEYISIFMNGRGQAAHGPIPPGIPGFVEGEAGINPFVYNWYNGRAKRKSIDVARRLLAEAGYPNGIDAEGQRLTLHYDTASVGPASKAMLNWYRKQFEQLGIDLVIRATDYNRFQDKVRTASVQLFSWGWGADYPDPENFLFLLNGQNSVINTDGSGINGANYDNPEFNALFNRIKRMENSPERMELIQQAVRIAQEDAPWVWGFFPKSLTLHHSWYHNVWANPLAINTLKYRRIDYETRVKKQELWNQPVIWPLFLMGLLFVLSIFALVRAYRLRQQSVVFPEDVPSDLSAKDKS